MQVRKKEVWYFLLVFSLLKPTGLDELSQVANVLMNIARLIAILLLNFQYFQYVLKRKHIGKFIFLFAILEILIIVSCMINFVSVYEAIVFWHGTLTLLMFAECYKEYQFQFLCKTVMRALGMWVLVNAVFIGLNYENLSYASSFVLGAKNMLILYAFPFTWLVFLYDRFFGISKWKLLMSLLISGTSVLYSFSATSKFVWVVVVMWFFLDRKKFFFEMIAKLKALYLVVGTLAFFVLIVCFNVQNYFSVLIVVLLNRDLTFTGRTEIWSVAIRLIQERLYGYGWNTAMNSMALGQIKAQHAHNMLLNIAYTGGVLAAFVYILILFYVAYSIDVVSKVDGVKNISKIGVGVFLLMGLVESYPTNCLAFFFVFYLSAELNKIEKGYNLMKLNKKSKKRKV